MMYDLITNESVQLIEKKLSILKNKFSPENAKILVDIYQSVPDQKQKILFSFLHYELNKLIRYMYNKTNGHFNANESRELITIVELLESLKANLKDTIYNFEIDPDYEELLKQCKSFLQPSNGSSLPYNLKRIELIDHKSIFRLTDSVSVPGDPTVSYTLKYKDEGSYAHVYTYLDTQYNLPVIVKRAKKNLTDIEKTRFRNEFSDLKKLDSPYIIKAYHFNEAKMEYSMEQADETLDKYITRMNDRLSMADRIKLITQLLQAFKYIHSEHLLHRDISYYNILIKSYPDNSTFIKVADFGLAKHPDRKLTRQGTEIKGIINDPNLAKVGFDNFEARHDIYAIMYIINFILTGKKNGIQIENEKVLDFIDNGINPDINKRYSNVNELLLAFESIIPLIMSIYCTKL